jgi:hypothetical protein
VESVQRQLPPNLSDQRSTADHHDVNHTLLLLGSPRHAPAASPAAVSRGSVQPALASPVVAYKTPLTSRRRAENVKADVNGGPDSQSAASKPNTVSNDTDGCGLGAQRLGDLVSLPDQPSPGDKGLIATLTRLGIAPAAADMTTSAQLASSSLQHKSPTPFSPPTDPHAQAFMSSVAYPIASDTHIAESGIGLHSLSP